MKSSSPSWTQNEVWWVFSILLPCFSCFTSLLEFWLDKPTSFSFDLLNLLEPKSRPLLLHTFLCKHSAIFREKPVYFSSIVNFFVRKQFSFIVLWVLSFWKRETSCWQLQYFLHLWLHYFIFSKIMLFQLVLLNFSLFLQFHKPSSFPTL